MSKNILNNFFGILICLVPLTLPLGPFLPDFFLSICCLLFLYWCVWNNNFIFAKNNFFKIFIIFWFFLIISSIFSENILPSLKSSFFYIRHALFILLVIVYFNNNKNFEKKYLISLISIFAVVTIFALIQYFYVRFNYISDIFEILTNYNYLNNPEGRPEVIMKVKELTNTVSNRLTILFRDEQVVGSYLLRTIPFLFIFIINYSDNFSKKKKIFFNLIFILSIFVILNSGERTSLILLVFNILLTIIFLKKIRSFFKYSFVVIIFISLVVLNYDPVIKSRVISQTLNNIKHGKGYYEGNLEVEKRKYFISYIHEGHIVGAWEIFKDNMVLGAGLKGYRHNCYNNPKYQENKNIVCSSHPHNIFMQFLSETGLVGTFFYFVIFVLLSFKFLMHFIQIYFKKKLYDKSENTKLCCLIAIYINIWPIAPSGSFFNNWLSILFLLPVITYLYKVKSINESLKFNFLNKPV